ncbi:MAG TPA: hypothetical protein VJH05_01340 [Candidatus Paceibacterota bacterium]
MKILILAMFLLQEPALLPIQQGPNNPPSVNGWKKVTEIHLELKNVIKSGEKTMTATSIVGSFRVLQNPELESEFVFMVSKYPPLTFVPQLLQSAENTRDEMVVAENYFQKVKQEKLKEMIKFSDTILLIKWRESKDLRTGETILLGPIENWLLNQQGKWIFESTNDKTIKRELVSEEDLLLGFKFSLKENYHILRLNMSHLGGEK